MALIGADKDFSSLVREVEQLFARREAECSSGCFQIFKIPIGRNVRIRRATRTGMPPPRCEFVGLVSPVRICAVDEELEDLEFQSTGFQLVKHYSHCQCCGKFCQQVLVCLPDALLDEMFHCLFQAAAELRPLLTALFVQRLLGALIFVECNAETNGDGGMVPDAALDYR